MTAVLAVDTRSLIGHYALVRRRDAVHACRSTGGDAMGALEIVDQRYRLVYDRAMEVLGNDRRVLSATLTGSVADGTADPWSDLDLVVITHPEDHDEFVASWPEWLAAITPTVFARTPIAPFIINAVTADGLTVDFAIFSGVQPAFPPPSTQYTVGFLPIRFDSIGEALEYAVVEQLRGLAGPFLSLVLRDEHIRYLTGVPHLMGLLTTVFLAETGELPPGKHWNRTFTSEQQAAVASLPALRATRADVIAWGLALAELIVSRARPLYPRYSLVWPEDFAVVAAARVEQNFGVNISGWLY
ncbi:MAG: nucleotidyltransferase domain-containing protein [Acidimicrobiia bacterium]